MPEEAEADIYIAMPVYRGEEHVAESLRSIRDQSYRGFTVAMSVDGADDPGLEVCASFTSDPRFRLLVQPQRLGWPGNLNWLAARCDKPYFCYWQQDDLASTSYLGALRAALLTHPSAAIASTDVQWFGGRFDREGSRPIIGTPLERVLAHIEHLHFAPLRGLMRADLLPDGPDLIAQSPEKSCQEEFVLLADMAAAGDFVRSPDALYFKRLHAHNTFSRWMAEPPGFRRAGWMALGAGLLRVGSSVAPEGTHGRLLATLLDRLTVVRPGRGFFYEPEQEPGAIARFVASFVDRCGIDLNDPRWSIDQGSGFEVPIHPHVHRGLELARRRAAAVAELAERLAQGRAEVLPAGDGGEAQHLLSDGWHQAEGDGIWSEGPASAVAVPAPVRHVELVGHLFAPDGPAVARVTAEGSEETTEVVAAPGEPVRLRLRLPGGQPQRLRVEVPGATSPLAAGVSADPRVLGFFLTEVTLSR